MIIIGIAGGTGSGKTTVVNKIATNLPQENVTILPQDAYYKDNSELTFEERQKINYDHPNSIDFDLLLNHVTELKNGSDVVLGYRDQTYYDNLPRIRKVISLSFRGFMKYVLRWPISDTQCGLKGFSKKGKEVLTQTQINRYLFDVKLIQRCKQKQDIIITPVNVKLRDGVVFSSLKPTILLNELTNLIWIFLPFMRKKRRN